MTARTEIIVRLSTFGSILLLMALWEVLAPRRRLSVSKYQRWASNLGLVFLNALVARWIIPLSLVVAAFLAESRGWGFLHMLAWPTWLEVALAVLAFDLAIYLQHVLFHAIPALWRIHLVHHADLDFDVTTGLRFHTFEILISAVFKLALVFALGPSPLAVVLFEILLNATSMFNHSNIQLPLPLDRTLRWFIVTPDMHRVHHSTLRRETNSNYGFNLPWWDYLLGTYRAQPAAGHQAMTIGVAHLRDELSVDRLPGMLLLPFRRSSRSTLLPSSSDSPASLSIEPRANRR